MGDDWRPACVSRPSACQITLSRVNPKPCGTTGRSGHLETESHKQTKTTTHNSNADEASVVQGWPYMPSQMYRVGHKAHTAAIEVLADEEEEEIDDAAAATDLERCLTAGATVRWRWT
jgi:hypothetical protein